MRQRDTGDGMRMNVEDRPGAFGGSREAIVRSWICHTDKVDRWVGMIKTEL